MQSRLYLCIRRLNTLFRIHDTLGWTQIKSCMQQKRITPKAGEIDIRHEIRILKVSSGHPNILKYINHFVINNYVYLVTEIEDGAMSFIFSCFFNGLPENKARSWFKQMIEGVNHLHSLGIVHRDIKPDNFLIRKLRNGITVVKLADFGLARFLFEAKPEVKGSSRVGSVAFISVAGTEPFYSPQILEMELCGKSLDDRRETGPHYDGKAADIWALGICLYSLSYNTYPFSAYLRLRLFWRKWQRLMLEQKWGIPFWARMRTNHHTIAFLMRILDPNEATRITAEELKNHDWLKGPTEEPGFLDNFSARFCL